MPIRIFSHRWVSPIINGDSKLTDPAFPHSIKCISAQEIFLNWQKCTRTKANGRENELFPVTGSKKLSLRMTQSLVTCGGINILTLMTKDIILTSLPVMVGKK